MSLRIDYADTPVGAQESAVISATAGQPFSCAEELKNAAVDIPWATLEPGGWPLDGSRRLIPDGSGKMGWWSYELSELDGGFAQPPTIVLTFPKPYSATGLTLSFCPAMEQWCSQIQVLWYRGDTLLDQVLAYPDAAEWILTRPVENFDRVELRLLKTNIPRRFAKLRQVQIGRIVSYFSNEIVSVQLLNETDPSLCSLSVDTMTVEIRNRNGDPILPQKDQRFSLFRDDVQIASHYITGCERQSRDNYKFKCQSAIGRLEDMFLGGMYNQYPLETILQDVLEQFPFRIDSTFYGQTVTGYLPVCTRREALQQIAIAVGAVVSTQGDGTIRLQPLELTSNGRFENKDIFTGAKLDREPQITEVRLVYHNYVQSQDVDVLLNEEQIDGEKVFVSFSDPHYNYWATGGHITASGTNWVTITAHDPVTLKAYKYQHTAVLRTKKNPFASAAEKGNVLSVEKATLINAQNADEILERLYLFSAFNNVLTQDAVISQQYAGQIVESPAPWGPKIEGYITSMESEFTTNGHTAKVEIRGREVAE